MPRTRLLNSYLSMAAILALAAITTVAGQTTTKLEIRLAEVQPGPGLVEAVVSGSQKKVYLHDTVVISNADLSEARVIPGNGGSGFNVAIRFNATGSDKLAKATETHIDKPLAILVDGKVIAAPTLRSPLRDSAVLTGDWTKEQADKIAAGRTGSR